MAIIYKITIDKAEVNKNNENTNFKLYYTLEQNQTKKYAGPFWLLLHEDGRQIDKIPFYGEDCAEFTEMELDPRRTYEVSITASERFVTSCNKVKLLLNTYQQVDGTYEKGNLKISWKQYPQEIDKGICLLFPENNPERTYPIPEDSHHLNISIPTEDFIINEYWETYLVPKWSGITYGISTESMKVFTEPVKLITADKTDSGLRVCFSLPDRAYREKDKIKICFALLKNNITYFQTEKLNIAEMEKTNQFLLEFSIQDRQFLHNLEEYQLAGYLGTDNTLNIEKNNDNLIPLKAAEVSLSHQDGGKVLLQWDYDNLGCTGYQIYADGEPLSQIVYGNQYVFESGKDVINKRIAVAPLFGSIRGVVSKEAVLFQSAFYEVMKNQKYQLYYHQDAYGEEMTRVSLSGTMFDEALTEEVVIGPVQITPKENGYSLSIKREDAISEENFENLIQTLLEHKLNIEGYYQFRNLFTRMLDPSLDNLLYYYCGMKKHSYMADIMPGTTLVSETALFQKQDSAESDDRNGFIRNGSCEYFVTLSKEGYTPVLEFNRFIGTVAGDFGNNNSLFTNDKSFRNHYAGLIDLFHSNLRKPFYRILYPASLHDSMFAGTPYPSDNITVVAASSLDELKSVNGVSVNDIYLPHIILRGRSSVSIKITVFVNRCPVSVDLGITLGQFLTHYSITSLSKHRISEKIKMRRETGLGDMAEFMFQWLKNETLMNQIPLLPGDRIEV